jgi:hypothetical protein
MRTTVFTLALLLVCLLTGSVNAQTSSNEGDAPRVTVIKNSSRKKLRSPMIDQDPLGSSQGRLDEVRALKGIERENARRSPSSQQPVRITGRVPPSSTSLSAPISTPPDRSIQYIFEAKIRNTGTKKIRLIGWEYVLIHPFNLYVLGNRHFTSKVNLSPGKSAKLIGSVTQIMSGFDDLDTAYLAERVIYPEHVVINRIEYDDGSVWVQPYN